MSISIITAQNSYLELDYQISDDHIKINWSRPIDFNPYVFELEKLDDKNNWRRIQFVRAKADQDDFIISDTHPSNGINSFRVKMKNREGVVLYSQTKEVFYESVNFDLLIYPNPANAWLVINADRPNATYSVLLIDKYGTIVLSGETDQSSCVLNTSSVMEGMYFIKVQGEGTSFKKAVVINHR